MIHCEVVGVDSVTRLHSSFSNIYFSHLALWSTGGHSPSNSAVHPSLWSLAAQLSVQVTLASFNPLRGDWHAA